MRTILHNNRWDERRIFFFDSVDIFCLFYISSALLIASYYDYFIHRRYTQQQWQREREKKKNSKFNLILSINHVLARKMFLLCISHELLDYLGDIHLCNQTFVMCLVLIIIDLLPLHNIPNNTLSIYISFFLIAFIKLPLKLR